MTTTEKFAVGDRVVFKNNYELFHLGVLVQRGEEGSITDTSDGICVRMDKDYGDSLEDWDNEIVFMESDDPGITGRYIRKA
jgi:hypothetical protein